MFEALWLSSFLVGLATLRWFRRCFLCDSRCEGLIRFFLCTDYVFLHGFLLGVLLFLLTDVAKHLPELNWLDPATLEEQFVTLATNSTLQDKQDRRHIVKVVSLKPFAWVRWSSLFAPVPVLLTWLVCAWHTLLHTWAIWTKAGNIESHDLAIQIIALPMVYSLMSLSALVRMWRVMSNFFHKELDSGKWDTQLSLALDIYEADYMIADLYESWALHHFAVLAMQVLQRSFEAAGSRLHRSASSLDGTPGDYQSWAGTMRGLHKSVRHLTMQGIWSFVIVCAVQSSYGLAAPLLEEVLAEQLPDVVDAMRHNHIKVRFFFLGTGSVASTAAICNILQIERIFHFELQHFRPRWKFWGTKVLVSIAFLQSLVFMLPIAPFKHMSKVQANLAYSTVLCYECFFISILHLYAWHAHEPWYKEGLLISEEDTALTCAESLEAPSYNEDEDKEPHPSKSSVAPAELGKRRIADDGSASKHKD